MEIGFALLLAALVLFYVGTRQFDLPLRMSLWAGGFACALAAVLIARSHGDYLGLAELATRDPATFLSLIVANQGTVAATYAPLFDLMALGAATLGLLALLALTPGERLERLLRPVKLIMIGMIFGGIGALWIAGIGYGDLAKRRVYMGQLTDKNVVDGDTLVMGDVSLRLYGIDAPEDKDATKKLAMRATSHIQGLLINNKFVVCHSPKGISASELQRYQELSETFGRPLVACSVYIDNIKFDLGKRMVEDGFAYPYTASDGDLLDVYLTEARAACEADNGLWTDPLFEYPRSKPNSPRAAVRERICRSA